MNTDKPIPIAITKIPSIEPTFFEMLSGFLVPVIAVIGAYIAYQQYRINEQRLRHETYERRIEVYRVVRQYLSEIARNGKTSYERAAQFYSEAAEAAFLFDSSIQNKIDEIHTRSIDMIENYEKMYPSDGSEGLPPGPERSQSAKTNSEHLKWHIKQLGEVRELFGKKLGLNVT